VTESPRPILGDDYPDAKRCPAHVRIHPDYPPGTVGSDRRVRIRCKRRRGHAGDTHVGRIETWHLPAMVRATVRWVARLGPSGGKA
jgi:hypothetical protein